MADVMEPDHPGMHTTDTIDVDLVISGEVWLELDDSGKELGRWTLPAVRTQGIAFTGDDLYSVTSTWDHDTDTTVWHLNRLNRKTGQWVQILTKELADASARQSFGILMDADDETLVLAREDGRILEWMKP